jgi:hypothetical protein
METKALQASLPSTQLSPISKVAIALGEMAIRMGEKMDAERLSLLMKGLNLQKDLHADAVLYAIECWEWGSVGALPENSPDHRIIGRRFPMIAQLVAIANEFLYRRQVKMDEDQRRKEEELESRYPGSVDFLKRHPEYNDRWDAQVEAQWAAERAEQRERQEVEYVARQKQQEEEEARYLREREEEAELMEKAKAKLEEYRRNPDPELDAIFR